MVTVVNKYICLYLEGLSFEFVQHISREICGVSIEMDIWEHDDAGNYREKANVVFRKDGLKYTCTCVDTHNWEDCFYSITYHGIEYICFRKTLYGFTLLNAATLEEEFDYFPTEVLEGQESYIVVDAKSFADLIVFDGCYWAGPYVYYTYDHEKKRFLDLSEAYDFTSENKMEVMGDALVLTGTNQDDEVVKLSLTKEKIYHLLDEKGTPDFCEY